VVESSVEDVGGRYLVAQQRIGSLQHQGGLADLSRTGEQDGSRGGRRGQPCLQFAESGAPPFGQVSNGFIPPPGIELGQDGD
jgi:hypothetical protein